MHKRSKRHEELKQGLKPHIYLSNAGYLPDGVHPLVAQDKEALYVTAEGPSKLFSALALRFASTEGRVIN